MSLALWLSQHTENCHVPDSGRPPRFTHQHQNLPDMIHARCPYLVGGQLILTSTTYICTYYACGVDVGVGRTNTFSGRIVS
eukprot:5608750-Pleurochrysis_carterae.AAC.1